MTLPVQPPGGYSRGFPHKRLPYGGGRDGGGLGGRDGGLAGSSGFLKKHTHAPLVSPTQTPLLNPLLNAAGKPNAAAQASAVAAATTAVAAAKAAAQSAANATTNPGILAQVGLVFHILWTLPRPKPIMISNASHRIILAMVSFLFISICIGSPQL